MSPIVTLSWLALVWAVQVTLLCAVVARFVGFVPAWTEGGLWLLFVCSFVLGTAALMARFGTAVQSGSNVTRFFRSYVVVETLLTAMAISAVFQMTMYALRPQLAQGALVLVLLVMVLLKFTWPHWLQFGRRLWGFVTEPLNQPILRTLFQATFVLALLLALYVPDMDAVVARDFLGQQFHHLDGSFVAPAYAAFKGGRLYLDHSSYYGLGIPVELATLSRWLGGFTYERLLNIIMWAAIAYYIALYFFMRSWTKSAVVAAACIVLAIRAQMFQTGVVPIVWTTPQASVFRFVWDVAVFWMVWAHATTLRRRYLAAAALFCGISVWHMTSTGMSISFAFGGYILFWLLQPQYRRLLVRRPRDWLILPGLGVIAIGIALLLFYLSMGPGLFSKECVENVGDFIHFYMSSFFTSPFDIHVKNKSFMLLFMGFVYPIVYILSLTTVGALCWLNQVRREWVLVPFLALHGLGMYQYFVVVTSNYYAAGLPFFLILFFVIHAWAASLGPALRRKFNAALLVAAVYCLCTTHMFCGYPNIFNLSRNPMVDPKVAQLLDNRLYYFNQLFIQYPEAFKLPKNSLGETNEDLRVEKDFSSDEELKRYYQSETNYLQDVKLIQSLTPKDAQVALVSSFEVLMLMQADRKPFFYYFPFVNSRPLRMRIFVTTHMFTKGRFRKTIAQLEDGKTPYLFMEKIFLNRQVPQAYEWDSVDLMNFLRYVHDHYEPYQEGQYLVAMKRKQP